MFLVKITINREPLAQRDVQRVSQSFDALRDWYSRHRQSKKLIGLYTIIPSGSGGFTIWDVDSVTELDQLLQDHPLTGAIETEVIGITDQFDQQIAQAKGVAPRFR